MKVVVMPIEVVTWHDREGIATPVRFRVTTKDDKEQVVKILRIVSRDMERLAGNTMHIYNCLSEINGVERELQIKYEVDTCKWMLFKI